MTADQLSEKTRLRLRYAQEWLNAQAASGFVEYEPAEQTYTLTPEAAMVPAGDTSPTFMCGGFECVLAMCMDIDKVQKAFVDGTGLGWHEHHPSLFSGTERFFRAGYNANLEPNWIPELDGMAARLRSGARVADVDCGFGASTILLAKAYPASISSAMTTTSPRSLRRVSARGRRAWLIVSPSKWLAPKHTRAATSTWSPSSTVCTIWATQSVRHATCERHWPTTVSG